jgi:hypothetical protein
MGPQIGLLMLKSMRDSKVSKRNKLARPARFRIPDFRENFRIFCTSLET